MNYATSPFNTEQNIANNKEAVMARVEELGLKLPPEEARHFISHCNEMNPIAIIEAFSKYNGKAGVHEIEVTADCAVTRLQGPKMGGKDLTNELRFKISRGLDRPFQPVIQKNEPFQSTNIISLIIFPNENGELTLWTMHAGPAMPPDFAHSDWKSNALAYTTEEIEGLAQENTVKANNL